nr:hypothetical protein [Tanacetum cinerariifolium]
MVNVVGDKEIMSPGIVAPENNLEMCMNLKNNFESLNLHENRIITRPPLPATDLVPSLSGPHPTTSSVGDNQNHFYNNIGELLCNFPFNYDRWAKVPEVHKTVLTPGVFRLVATFKRPDHNYRSRQAAYSWVTSPGWATMQFQRSVERQEKQAQGKSGGMAGTNQFWADPKRMNIAKKNAEKRAKKKTTSHQGSKSFAQGRHEFFVKLGWRRTHLLDAVFHP